MTDKERSEFVSILHQARRIGCGRDQVQHMFFEEAKRAHKDVPIELLRKLVKEWYTEIFDEVYGVRRVILF